jgi:hypothetical protein
VTPASVAAVIHRGARQQQIAVLVRRVGQVDADLDAELRRADEDLARDSSAQWPVVARAAHDFYVERVIHAAGQAAERRQQLLNAIAALDYPAAPASGGTR